MEEERIINYPYYETTYLDDNDTLHFAKIQTEKDLNFFKERFTVVSSKCISQEI